MNRRDVLATLASTLIWPMLAAAQQPARVPVVGMLITHPPVDDQVVESVRIGLRQYGYEDGRNIKLEVRTALGRGGSRACLGRGPGSAPGGCDRARQ
jgi:putative ABC transport system substrate-binding protein